jgi:predicted Fe-Mo cluster-binding NifX family protein
MTSSANMPGTAVAFSGLEAERMVVAVSAWEGRVSPVLDTARHMVCFHIADGVNRPAGVIDVPSDDPQTKLKKLQEAGAEVLICGAVSAPLAAMLSAMGLRLVPFCAGEVAEIINAFADGRLDGACYRMPGCCGRAHRRRWGHRGRRWWEPEP